MNMPEKLFLSDSNNKTDIKDSFGIHTNIADTIVEVANNETINNPTNVFFIKVLLFF